jgi:hypothetical protein
MPAMGLPGSTAAAGLTVSFRADHEHHIGVGQFVVDLVHLQDDVIRHARLGEQHVHVTGQAAGDGVDTEAHRHSAFAQSLD